MNDVEKSFEEETASGDPLAVGQLYEVVHGPASSLERTTDARLVDIDLRTKAYTFELSDGTRISIADDAIDSVRHISHDLGEDEDDSGT